jgi:hypothetical protein
MCSKPNPAGAETCRHCHARLKPVIGSAQPAGNAAERPSAPDASSDWLGDLRAGNEDAFATGLGETLDSSDEGDWFSRLGEPEAPQQAAKPDWLAAPTEKGDPNKPDWMEELGVADRGVADDESTTDQDDLKNWLAGLSATEDAPAPDAGGVPDWLRSLSRTDATDSRSSPTEREPGENLPEWLASLSGDEPAFSTPSTTPSPAEPASDLPDWLTAPGGLPDVAQEQAQASSESDFPDWLQNLQAPDLGTSAPKTSQPEETTEIPSWLVGDADAGTPEQQQTASLFSEREPPTQPVADWFSQFEQATSSDTTLPEQMLVPDEPPSAKPLKKPFPTGALDTGDLSAFGSVPDWLSDLSEMTLADEEDGETEQASLPTAKTDWLAGLDDLAPGITDTPAQPPAQAPGVASAFVMGDEPWEDEGGDVLPVPELDATPDWLSSITASDVSPAEELPPAAADDSQTALAELPTWLQAMRPVGAAAPASAFREEADGRVENAGPLRGIRGVLQAEPDIANFRKPPVYVNKLQVTEAHQAHLALLDELLAAEGKPRPVQPFVAIKSQIALRWIIAVGLIAAVLLGLWFKDTQMVALPDAALPPEITNLRGSIEALPPNAPVLVAVDYEAGAAAEMEYLAVPVVQNLEQKEAFLTFASTTLNGPFLSQRLLQAVDAQSQITYTNYTLLGYLPGGTSGLLNFALSPRQALAGALDGRGWNVEPLKSDVYLVSDFALVVVMTDSADTARMWIEQLRPRLDADTPLLMVLSAQAEPMVRPYFQQSFDPNATFDANQVQVAGYVAGIAGAAAYQSRVNPQVIFKAWDGVAWASLVSIIVIALGGMFNLSLAISSRPKSKK